MEAAGLSVAGLWSAVVLSGVWHGVNPGMGWPLAVSAGLMGRGRRDVLAALVPLAFGHALAMLAVLLPFTFAAALLEWERPIRLGAALLLIGFGLWRLVDRRHPRAIARIPPGRLALWSFAVALAHGAGLMLLPIHLGICAAAPAFGADGTTLASGGATALAVALLHALAMIGTGGAMAMLAHDRLGLRFISRSWFNLEWAWAGSLVLVGLAALATA